MSPQQGMKTQRGVYKHVRWLLVMLLVVTLWWALYHTSWFRQPLSSLPAPHEREPFGVDFTLPDTHGKPWRLADLHGRPVLLNLWATWCYPCRVEMPSLQALYQAYQAQGFVVLGVASDSRGREVVAPFMQKQALTFPVVLDPQNVLGLRLQAPGIPTSYLLDRSGRIVAYAVGIRDWNSRAMRQRVEQLLAESPHAAEGPRAVKEP